MELYEYLRREYSSMHMALWREFQTSRNKSKWSEFIKQQRSKWCEFIEQQNLGVVIPPGSEYYSNAVFQVVDPKQFLMTSIRLGLQYEDVPTSSASVVNNNK
jgi:hypothetical protein